jgi:hypothetical protein
VRPGFHVPILILRLCKSFLNDGDSWSFGKDSIPKGKNLIDEDALFNTF